MLSDAVTREMNEVWAHHTATIDIGAKVERNTVIWHFSHLMSTAKVGLNCTIGDYVFIAGTIGNNCRIQNGTNVFEGVTLEDNVFVGPGVQFTNVKRPKAGTKQPYQKTLVKRGATIGAGAVIICGVTIGEGALVGAGSVVTKDVPPGATVVGNPARVMDE